MIEDLQIVIRRPVLKSLLFGWNFCLSVQSIVSFLQAWPHFAHWLSLNDICDNSWTQGPLDTVGLLFAYSKIVELGDTIFLVLSFKKVPFLHWYHHLSVLWQTFVSHWAKDSSGILFVMMNLAVHAWMYMYFALKSLGLQVPGSKALTASQILQMFMGIQFSTQALECPNTMALTSLAMQTSQAILFLKFFVQRYFKINQDD